MKLTKKCNAAIIAAALTLAASMPNTYAAMSNFTANRTYADTFSDVKQGAWYYNALKTAYELGLVNGTSGSTYSPNGNLTIAEVQALAARIHAAYYGNTIPEKSGNWYNRYIDYCAEHIDREIANMAYMADGDSVSANTPASRTYFAYMLYGALPDNEYQVINNISAGTLSDVNNITFKDATSRIYALYRAGILTGSDAYGTFHPDSNITRAEAACIIARMIDTSQRKTFALQEKTTPSLGNYTGDWYFNSWPDSGISIEQHGSLYYISLTIVQGKGIRFNGTLEPVPLRQRGDHYETSVFDTMQGTTAIIFLRPESSNLVVSCTEHEESSLSINFSEQYCSRR